jgi:hypothetical protein
MWGDSSFVPGLPYHLTDQIPRSKSSSPDALAVLGTGIPTGWCGAILGGSIVRLRAALRIHEIGQVPTAVSMN